MKSMKSAAQAGFTLIELIVVIVILGILAATALPKFVSFGNEARAASVNAAKGSMASAASMIKGRWTVDGKNASTVSVEGSAVNVLSTSGYPLADATFIAAAGLTNDYTVITSTTSGAGTTAPTVASGSIGLVPNGISGTAASVNCFALYTPPSATSTTTSYTATATTSTC